MKKQYASYKETIAFLEEAVGTHPHLIKVDSIGTTWEGRPIMMATISTEVAYADKKPALLYTGSIHAREWIGNELAIKFIQYILDNYRFEPRLLDALTRNTLYIVPCLNPDGFEYSRTHFSFWRKNRRNNGDGTFGVDLNRNFSTHFKRGADTSSNIYSGPEPFSEPETRAIKDFVETHDNIRIALDYHSQGNVFFPAHKFNHESELEGTDLNVLCANMVHEIHKVTGRKYGIHRGKPPANLINGSGREYYYNRGIIATVVEVGTRNIPDYMANMSQSIDENIPALIHALSEAINYSDLAPQRVDNFTVAEMTCDSVTLSWDYPEDRDVSFEIYRSETPKSACVSDMRVGITHSREFTDVQLKSGQKYFYNIRAVDRVTKIKSPFCPEVKLKTDLANDEFSKTLFPAAPSVGYVGEYAGDKNKAHFGNNSLFIGINKRKGICYGIVNINLDNIPENAIIKSASLHLYPMNRVGAKIERYGEWAISVLEPEIPDYTDFKAVHDAKPLHVLGDAIPSDKVTQGIWSAWQFNGHERKLLQSMLSKGRAIFRIDGPTELPLGNDSQMMQFDVGYGRFGGGIHYRPHLEIIYTIPPTEVALKPVEMNSIYSCKTETDVLCSGFDKHGEKVYGQLAFDLSSLPDPSKTVITEAYVLLKNKNTLSTQKDLRFSIEMAEFDDNEYTSVKQRERIEYIGYEIGTAELKDNKEHYFICDSYTRGQLEYLHENQQLCSLVLRTTSSWHVESQTIDWHGIDDDNCPQLIVRYIERRKEALPTPTDFETSIENGVVKLSWKNPKDDGFVGSYVVRNRFRIPRSPLDGVKLYAGKDEYTYDKFGNANIPKYYSVFSYDDVPNYSTPATLYYKINETIEIKEFYEEDIDTQDDDS